MILVVHNGSILTPGDYEWDGETLGAIRFRFPQRKGDVIQFLNFEGVAQRRVFVVNAHVDRGQTPTWDENVSEEPGGDCVTSWEHLIGADPNP